MKTGIYSILVLLLTGMARAAIVYQPLPPGLDNYLPLGGAERYFDFNGDGRNELRFFTTGDSGFRLFVDPLVPPSAAAGVTVPEVVRRTSVPPPLPPPEFMGKRKSAPSATGAPEGFQPSDSERLATLLYTPAALTRQMTPGQIPEPTSLALCAAGLLLAFPRARKPNL